MKCFDNEAAPPDPGRPGRARDAPEAHASHRADRAALVIVLAALPVRLALALATDLSPDEAYYLSAARLDQAIVDHPPLLMWLLRASDRWTSAPIELRVRVWAMLFSLATGLACFVLAKRRGAGPQGTVLAAWIGSWALLPMAGGFVTTPDGPFLLAVALALLAADPRAPRALAGGAALFAGALAKVTALPVAVALAAGLRGTPVAARLALIALPAVALPWLWPSLRFQLHHAFAQKAPTGWTLLAALGAVPAALAAQAALWSPAVIWRGARALPDLPRPDRLLVLGLTALLLVSALARAIPPEPNWWAPAAIVVLAAFARTADALSPRARRAILAGVLVPTAIAVLHTMRPFLPLPPSADPTARLHGWSHGSGPADAPGVGVYGVAAERCAYRNECSEILSYFKQMHVHE